MSRSLFLDKDSQKCKSVVYVIWSGNQCEVPEEECWFSKHVKVKTKSDVCLWGFGKGG